MFFSRFENLVKKIILEDTDSLLVDSKEVDHFIEDARRYNIWDMFSFSKKEFIKWSFYIDNPFLKLPYNAKYKIYRSQIVGLFLLSTDYFRNKMAPDKPVHYIAIYNPYSSPCSNPFSNLFYS